MGLVPSPQTRLSAHELECLLVTTSGTTALSRNELSQMARKLPPRPSRRLAELDDRNFPASVLPETASSLEAESLAHSAKEALRHALRELRAEDRLVLRLRFGDGLTVRQISSALSLEAKPLYGQIRRCLAILKRSLESKGLDFPQAQMLIEWSEFSLGEELEGAR